MVYVRSRCMMRFDRNLLEPMRNVDSGGFLQKEPLEALAVERSKKQ